MSRYPLLPFQFILNERAVSKEKDALAYRMDIDRKTIHRQSEEFRAVKVQKDILNQFLQIKADSIERFINKNGFIFGCRNRTESVRSVLDLQDQISEALAVAEERQKNYRKKVRVLPASDESRKKRAKTVLNMAQRKICDELSRIPKGQILFVPRIERIKGELKIALRPQNLASWLMWQTMLRVLDQALCSRCGKPFHKAATGRPRQFCTRCSDLKRPEKHR